MAGRPRRRARMNAGKVATLHGVDMGDYPEAAAYYARREKEQQDFLHRLGESQIADALRRGAQSEEKFRHRLHNTANFNYKKVLDSMLAEGKIERFERGGETFLRLRVPTFAEFQERRSFDPAMGRPSRLGRARRNSQPGVDDVWWSRVSGPLTAAQLPHDPEVKDRFESYEIPHIARLARRDGYYYEGDVELEGLPEEEVAEMLGAGLLAAKNRVRFYAPEGKFYVEEYTPSYFESIRATEGPSFGQYNPREEDEGPPPRKKAGARGHAGQRTRAEKIAARQYGGGHGSRGIRKPKRDKKKRRQERALVRLNRARMNSRHGPSVAFDGAVGGKALQESVRPAHPSDAWFAEAFAEAFATLVAAAYPVVRVVSVNHPREGGYYDPDAPYSAQLEIRYPTSKEVGAIVYLNHQGDGLLRTRSGQIDIDENQDPALRAAAEVLDMGLSRGPGPGRGPRGW